MTGNADYVGQVTASPQTEAEQVEYWQERYFRLLDEHAALIKQLQEIRRILDPPPFPPGDWCSSCGAAWGDGHVCS